MMKTLRNRGMTLVELLVAMTIIAILVAVTLGAIQAAKEAARKANTRSLVRRIHEAVLDAHDSALNKHRTPIVTKGLDSVSRAMALRNAKLDYLRMVCPDRWSDVLNPPLVLKPPLCPTNYVPGRTLSMRNMHHNKLTALMNDGMAEQDARDLIEKNGSAELLYLIVRTGRNPNAVGEQHFGDTDGDGFQEILDAWGKPIRWIRWPAGYLEEYGADESLISTGSMDVIDRMGLVRDDYTMIPLIYSAGPDQQYDVSIGHGSSGETYEYRLYPYQLGNGRQFEILRTCTLDDNPLPGWPNGMLIGTPWDGDDGGDGREGWYDNITNHQRARVY